MSSSAIGGSGNGSQSPTPTSTPVESGQTAGEPDDFPIEIDLSGSGIGITQFTSSNTFEAIDSDGYQHRTAWAAAGDAVLFVDPNGLNNIRDADQYIFTDWDPSATSDMNALRNVFDTNHDGSLDAGDAAFGEFKLMVTNADGTTSVETLAQAGIASIDLTQTSVTQSFADGSSIEGETSFTRTDGTTGTVASVTYAADANGYAVQNTVTANADGSTTVDNRALNADGSLNNDTSSTTSADGATRTISYDSTGTGVIDHVQTITTTTDAAGSRTETVSDYDGQQQLRDRTVTTTTANGDVTIDRDLTGGGITDQVETRTTQADGSIVDTLSDVSASGAVIDSTTTLIGADGLSRDVEIDDTGDGTYDHSTSYRTVVNADGSRTESIVGVNQDQSETSATTVVTSADAQTRTTSSDLDGDGTLDRVQVAQTTSNADGSVTTQTTTYDGDQGQVLGIDATTVSADGLSITTRMDMDGDGTFDRTTTDSTTTNDRGGQTEDVRTTSADGTLLSETTTARSTDGLSRNTFTYDGQGDVLASDQIGIGQQGGTVENASTYGLDGTLLSHVEKTTSADGLTTTTQTDDAGDGSFDRVTVDQTIENSDGAGGSAEIAGTRSADGTLLGRTRVETSADGLTLITFTDSTGARNADGTGVFDRVTYDATSYAADGSRDRTVTTTSADGTYLSVVTTVTSADRQSRTITTDANGDGYVTTSEQVTTAASGAVTDLIIDLNPDGSHVDGAERSTSADGLLVTTRIAAAGQGWFNRITTDDTVIGADGTRTETVTARANDGTVVGETVTASRSNGDLTTVSTDTAGDGTFDRISSTATRHDAGGGTTVTVTDMAANGTVRDRTTTITAGNGLSSEVEKDLDGDGVADFVTSTSMSYAANGDLTMAKTDASADGTLYDESGTTVTDDGRTTTTTTSYYGSHFGSIDYSTRDVGGVNTDGSRYDDLVIYDATGATRKETVTTTSGNGLSKAVQVDLDGAGTFDIAMTDDTVLNDDGSRTETMSSSGSQGLNSRTVVKTSGNGLSKTVQSDADGNGIVDTLTQDDTTLNANGTRHEVYTQTNADKTLRDSTTVDTSADGKHVTIGRVLGTDGTQTETIDRGLDGTVTDALVDHDGTGAALGGETVTTSANGLVKTATYTDAGGTVMDVQNDTRVLNTDGSTTERFSDLDSAAGVTALYTTTTQGNGLSRHTDASFNGFLSDYSVNDRTTLVKDGSPDEGSVDTDVLVSNTDGSKRDERIGSVSADGLRTFSATDEGGSAGYSIFVEDDKNTDGSEFRQTTIIDSDTGAQDRQDTVTTSADGRTLTLQSARDGDTTVRYTETTVHNADGTYSDTSRFLSGTPAPSWSQTRSQTLDTNGGQTIVVTDYDGQGGLADQATTTTTGNGLFTQTALDTTGDGTVDQLRSDGIVINADGSRQENVFSTLAPGAAEAGPGTMAYGRSITTSADGLTVTTATDDDGNGVSEKSETSVRGIDGSLTDTVTFYDNSTGDSVNVQASDGSTGTAITKTTSADGLIVTTSEGDVTYTKTYVASSNGSYRWTEDDGSAKAVFTASHGVDVNGIDTWTSFYIPDGNIASGPTTTTTTIQISTAREQAAVAEANAIYQTVQNRPMNDHEQESLIQYIHGGILDQRALAASLTANSTAYDLYFIQQAYQNDFGRDASATDAASYLAELQSGDRSQTRAELVVDIAERAVNEQAGNGLLALLPDAPVAKAGTVTLIAPATAAATNIAQNYATFTDAIGKPSGNLTPGQISQFGALMGDANAASAPQVDFASASSSTSGQGTAVPGFFTGGAGATARAPTGGAAGPLVVNLAGGKVHTTDLATSTVTFDDTASGTASATAWTTANEGFLVLDPKGTQVADGSAMISTFSALATYDADGDGTLTAAEADKAGVRIWVDANGDGVDQAGEVESFSQAGIASISLKDASTGSYDHGNVLAADSSVSFSNGITGDVADVWLAYGGALSQGATYQFGDDLVTRAADGTASELLYGSGETVDAGAVGLTTVVDAGSNNVLEAGSGVAVTLSGAAGDRLVGGTGIDTFYANGDNETVMTGTGTTNVYVSGAGTTVDASHGTSSIMLGGANDGVTGATASTTVDVAKGTGARIAAVGAKIVVEGGIGAEISGSADHVTVAGGSTLTLDASSTTLVSDAASTVTINGANDTLTLDRGSTVTVVGTGEAIGLSSGALTISAHGSATVTGLNDFATQAAGSALTIVGQSGTVDVVGTNVATALSHGMLVLESGSSDTLTGSNDQIVQTAGSTLALTGASASLVVTGMGNQSTLSDARVTIQSGASSHVTGSRDVIAASPTGLDGTLAGDDNRLTISGAGGKLSLAGLRDAVTMDGGNLTLVNGSSATLTGSNDGVSLGAYDTLTVDGSSDTIVAVGDGDVIDLRQGGDTVSVSAGTVSLSGGISATLSGNNDTITLAASDTLDLVGPSDAVTLNTLTLGGAHDTLRDSGMADVVDVLSTDASIVIDVGTIILEDNASATVTGDENQLTLASSGTLHLIGSDDTATVFGEANVVTVTGQRDVVDLVSSGDTVSIGSGTVNFGDSVTASVTGSSNSINLGTSDTLNANGQGIAIVATGGGDAVNLIGSGGTVSIDSGTVTLGDGAGASITGSNGGIGLGANATSNVSGQSNTITAYGSGDTIVAVGDGDVIDLRQGGDTVSVSTGTVSLSGGISATLSGNNDTITLAASDTLDLVGPSDAVTLNTLTLGGAHDTLRDSGMADVVNVLSTDASIVIDVGTIILEDNASATVTGDENAVTLASSGTLHMIGSDDTATVFGEDNAVTVTGQRDVVDLVSSGDTVSIGSGTVNFDDGVTASVTGSSNTITLGAHDALTMQGSGNQISASGAADTITDNGTGDAVSVTGKGSSASLTGANDIVTLGGTSETAVATGTGDKVVVATTSAKVSIGSGLVTLNDNATASVTGSADTITIGKSAHADVVGAGDTVNFVQSKSSISLQNNGSIADNVVSGSTSMTLQANGNVSVYGGLASSVATTASGHTKIALANTNSVTTAGIAATVDGYGTNNLHSWHEIFNTMSGALQETDQYQYNSSNSLMEIDRYNASNVKTQADLYDPNTSAEIGSYLYASNGHVNEVVDLLHNHDWLSQSDGTYKDKTSGAVSKTQPTLR